LVVDTSYLDSFDPFDPLVVDTSYLDSFDPFDPLVVDTYLDSFVDFDIGFDHC
jgi:hypothetical protein